MVLYMVPELVVRVISRSDEFRFRPAIMLLLNTVERILSVPSEKASALTLKETYSEVDELEFPRFILTLLDELEEAVIYRLVPTIPEELNVIKLLPSSSLL